MRIEVNFLWGANWHRTCELLGFQIGSSSKQNDVFCLFLAPFEVRILTLRKAVKRPNVARVLPTTITTT